MPARKKSATVVDVDAAEPSSKAAPVNAGATRARPSAFDVMMGKGSSAKVPLSEAARIGASVDLRQHLTEPSWVSTLAPLFSKPYFQRIEQTLGGELAKGNEIFPQLTDVFAAFNHCPLGKTRVVLIGQDPYHDVGQAHGLSFSVRPGVSVPPSLRNMYKELVTDQPGFAPPPHGCLLPWANQGMLLLNATLTVEAHQANSHAKIGWQNFTDDVIAILSEQSTPLVFLLWGRFAQAKGAKINTKIHRVISCAHPSPLSAAKWFGCKTFSKCNESLKELGHKPIVWDLPSSVALP